MREIKFKGKRKDNGEWIIGDIAHHDGIVSYIGQSPIDGSMVTHELEPETIGQFTGFKDMNGDEIFEHDLVQFCSKYCRNGECDPELPIVWLEYWGCFIHDDSGVIGDNLLEKSNEANYRLSGNIHDK